MDPIDNWEQSYIIAETILNGIQDPLTILAVVIFILTILAKMFNLWGIIINFVAGNRVIEREALNANNPDIAKIMKYASKAGIEKTSTMYNQIENKIQEEQLDVQKILTTNIRNLYKTFAFKDHEEKSKFKNQRFLLRKDDIEMKIKCNKISLNRETITKLKWYDMCQLFEQEIEANDDDQSEQWYDYLEKETIDGDTFLIMEQQTIVQVFGLIPSQKNRLTKLLDNLKIENTGNNINVHDAAIGVINSGGNVQAQQVYVAKNSVHNGPNRG